MLEEGGVGSEGFVISSGKKETQGSHTMLLCTLSRKIIDSFFAVVDELRI